MTKKLYSQAVKTNDEYGVIIGKLMTASTTNRHIWVTVEKFDGKHSDDQRKAFHALMGELSKEARNVGAGIMLSAEEWKRFVIKAVFGEEEFKNPDGSTYKGQISSSKLTCSRYAELITFTLDWAVHYFDGELTLQIKEK